MQCSWTEERRRGITRPLFITSKALFVFLLGDGVGTVPEYICMENLSSETWWYVVRRDETWWDEDTKAKVTAVYLSLRSPNLHCLYSVNYIRHDVTICQITFKFSLCYVILSYAYCLSFPLYISGVLFIYQSKWMWAGVEIHAHQAILNCLYILFIKLYICLYILFIT